MDSLKDIKRHPAVDEATRKVKSTMRAVEQAAHTVEETARETSEETLRKAGEKAHGISAQLERSLAIEPTNSLMRSALLALAGASVLGAVALHVAGRKHEALLVGQWAPSLLSIALWDQMVKNQRLMRRR